MAAGYNYTFVSDVPEEYTCSICQHTMRKPVQTRCGHRFCKFCLDESLKRRPQCPMDRTPLGGREHLSRSPNFLQAWPSSQLETSELQQDIFYDIASERTIMSYQVKCPNEENGCQWITELRNIEIHEINCMFAKLSCPNDNCDVTLLKKELLNHVTDECPRRRIRCSHCNKESYVWCLSQDHFRVCSRYPCSCPQQCGQKEIPREETDKHVRNDCPETLVECTFAVLGCKGKLKRKDLEQHLRVSIGSHLNLTCEKLQEVQKEHQDTKKELQQLQTEYNTTKMELQTLHFGHETTKIKLERSQKEHSTANRELQEVRAEHGDPRNKQQQLQTEHKTAKTELQEVQAEHGDTEKKLQQLQTEHNITKRELQEVRAEHGDTKKKLQQLQTEHNTAKTELQEVRVEHGYTKKKLQKLQTEHNTAKRELQEVRVEHRDTKRKLQQLQAGNRTTQERLNGFGNEYDAVPSFFDIQSHVDDTRSHILSPSWVRILEPLCPSLSGDPFCVTSSPSPSPSTSTSTKPSPSTSTSSKSFKKLGSLFTSKQK